MALTWAVACECLSFKVIGSHIDTLILMAT